MSYPLEAVEKERRRRRDAAQEALGECLAELAAAEERLKEAKRQRAALGERHARARRDLYRPQAGDALDVAGVQERRRGLDALARRLATQEAEVARREDDVAEAAEGVSAARRELATAAQNLSALEKHREKWRTELELEHRRKEEKLLDEISAAKFARAVHSSGFD